MQQGTEIFLARLNGVQVFDPLGDHVGKVRDVVFILSKKGVSRAVGLVVDVYGKRRIFIPLSKVTSITTSQVLVAGLLNLQRFRKRELEQLGFSDLLGRVVSIQGLEEGDDQFRIEDFSIMRQLNGEWQLAKLFVRKVTQKVGIKDIFKPKSETRFVAPAETDIFHSKDVVQMSDHIVESIEGMKAADAAEVILDLEGDRQIQVAKDLDNERLADVLEEMDEDSQIQLLDSFDDERIADVLEEMEPDDAADLLNKMPAPRAQELLEEMDQAEADDVRQLLEYSEHTAGGMMTTNPVILTPNSTVALALAKIRRQELSPPLASVVFVCQPPDETPTGRFLGVLHFQQLLRHPPHLQLGAIADTDVYFCYPEASVDEVSRVFATYNAMIVPVVDPDMHLLGAISVDDVIDHMLPSNWREMDMKHAGRYNAKAQ